MGWVPHVFGFCLCRDLGIPGCVSHTWSSAGREFDFGPDFRRHFGASGAMPRWQAWTAVSAIPVVEARDLDARVRAVEMGDTYGVWGGLAQTKSRESCGGSGPSLPKRHRCFWADSSPDPGDNRFLSFTFASTCKDITCPLMSSQRYACRCNRARTQLACCRNQSSSPSSSSATCVRRMRRCW